MITAKVKLYFPILIFLLAGCDTSCLKSVGKTERVTREILPFTTLTNALLSPVRIILYKDSISTDARLTGGKNILGNVTTKTIDRSLQIGFDLPRCDRLTQREIALEVPYQNLTQISHSGYDVLSFRDTLQTTNLIVTLGDQGDIQLPIKAENLSLTIFRTANAEVSGVVDNLNLRTSEDPFAPSTSFGFFRGKNLQTKNCTVLLQGEGDCEVRVSDTLRVTLTGVGNIIYYGNPKVLETDITGAGKVVKGD